MGNVTDLHHSIAHRVVNEYLFMEPKLKMKFQLFILVCCSLQAIYGAAKRVEKVPTSECVVVRSVWLFLWTKNFIANFHSTYRFSYCKWRRCRGRYSSIHVLITKTKIKSMRVCNHLREICLDRSSLHLRVNIWLNSIDHPRQKWTIFAFLFIQFVSCSSSFCANN